MVVDRRSNQFQPVPLESLLPYKPTPPFNQRVECTQRGGNFSSLFFFFFSSFLFFFHRRKFPRSSHICPAARRVREHNLIKGQTAEDQLQRVSFYVFSLFARFDKKDRPLLRPETRPQS